MSQRSLAYWRNQRTADILESLLPGGGDPLRVNDAGVIMNGNTRCFVLQERGYDLTVLPYVRWPLND